MKKHIITITILLAAIFFSAGHAAHAQEKKAESMQQAGTMQPEAVPQEPAQRAAMGSAHCNCKVMVLPLDGCGSGHETVVETKGGYMGCPLCKPKCKDYCRGVWDASSEATKKDWARTATSCGNVRLTMLASCATCDYDDIGRTATVNLGGQCITECKCEPGYEFDAKERSCKKRLCAVPGFPNQGVGEGFFIWDGYLFHKKAPNCKTFCK